jgi:hypothetical protein
MVYPSRGWCIIVVIGLAQPPLVDKDGFLYVQQEEGFLWVQLRRKAMERMRARKPGRLGRFPLSSGQRSEGCEQDPAWVNHSWAS